MTSANQAWRPLDGADFLHSYFSNGAYNEISENGSADETNRLFGVPGCWPVARTGDQGDQDEKRRGWRHGDFRDVAFVYTYKTYEKVPEIGKPNQRNR